MGNQKKHSNLIVEKKSELKIATEQRKQNMEFEFGRMPKIKVFENSEKYDQIIAQVGIPVTALCEHHEISFEGDVSIAYIPKQYLVGLSKLGRVAEYFLNPTIKTLQERATQQIMNYLQSKLKPKGLMIVVRAKHGCISYRGVKKPSLTITSAVQGVFANDNGARSEFLQLVNFNKHE